MFNLTQKLMQLEIVCAVLMLIALASHPFLYDLKHNHLVGMEGDNRTAAIVRSLLFIAAAAILLFDWQFVWPRIRSSRETYVEHADEPEIANPALDRFDHEQRKSLILVMIKLGLLLGIILFSTTIGAFTVLSAKS